MSSTSWSPELSTLSSRLLAVGRTYTCNTHRHGHHQSPVLHSYMSMYAPLRPCLHLVKCLDIPARLLALPTFLGFEWALHIGLPSTVYSALLSFYRQIAGSACFNEFCVG